MSLYGAMYAGVSGLFAQSQKLSAISDNVSNANTVGYKRTDVQFQTFVTGQALKYSHAAGGVNATVRSAVSQQGLVQGSSSSTDIAIAGAGMFVVNTAASPDVVAGVRANNLFTRAGSFLPDADGNLRNAAGYYLQGWKLNSDGSYVVGSPSRTSFDSLETVNVTGLNFTGTPTTRVRFAANLPSASTDLGGISQLAQPFTGTDPFADGDTVTLQLRSPTGVAGAAEQVVMTARATGPVGAGEFLVVAGDTAATIANLRAAMQSALPAGASGAGGISISASGSVLYANDTADESAWSLESLVTSTANVGTAGTSHFKELGNPITTTVEYFDNLGNAQQLDLTYTPTETPGLWHVTVSNRGDVGGLPVAELDVQFALSGTTAGAPTIVSASTPGSATFLGRDDQALGSEPVNQGDPIRLQLNVTNGTASATMPQTIVLDLGALGSVDGITQFAGEYTPRVISRDGAQFSSLARVEVGNDGTVSAIFQNGQVRAIYKLPLIEFVNDNGLRPVNGNAWEMSADAGAWYLWDPGQGPTGSIEGSSLEASTVDIAQEFSDMIVAQRAYSSNAKIIQTADEMLQELTNLKR